MHILVSIKPSRNLNKHSKYTKKESIQKLKSTFFGGHQAISRKHNTYVFEMNSANWVQRTDKKYPAVGHTCNLGVTFNNTGTDNKKRISIAYFDVGKEQRKEN